MSCSWVELILHRSVAQALKTQVQLLLFSLFVGANLTCTCGWVRRAGVRTFSALIWLRVRL